jgi:hypothetical protein
MSSRDQRRDQRIDRRTFLTGAGGAVLALPMLEEFTPRVAFGQGAAPPKRFVMMAHPMGRTAFRPSPGGNGNPGGKDGWSPLPTTGAFPATGDISPALASLGPVRNEVVTMDGVDDLVRHMTGDSDGHYSPNMTSLTCVLPNADKTAAGPSVDFVAGQRLRASPAQRSALVFPAYAGPDGYQGGLFHGANGAKSNAMPADPAAQVKLLFGSVATQPTSTPTAKTLHDRLVARRGSVLDAVAKEYIALGKRVNAADRERLDQHAQFLQMVQAQLGSARIAPVAAARGCATPNVSTYPKYSVNENRRGEQDNVITPLIVENLVMSLACDVTRTAALHYSNPDSVSWAGEFQGTSPFAALNWHNAIHGAQDNGPALTQAFQFLGRTFALLVRRLAEVKDVDGSRLLDNTLVLWVSDMGYGSSHAVFNNPVVLAGMKRAFPNGQGRHIVPAKRHSLGDLYAQVLRMLGGSDITFGRDGKVGDTGLPNGDFGGQTLRGYGLAGYVTTSTPLHSGPITEL